MSLKRFSATMSACFDSFVTKIENHDAVAKVAIVDIQKTAAKLRAEKSQLEQRIEKLDEQLFYYQNAAKTWRERAKRSAADEQKALQCLKQAKAIDTQYEQAELQSRELQSVLNTLGQNLQEVEGQLSSLKSKRALLASREARASVVSSLNKQHSEAHCTDVFDRWEQSVLEQEYAGEQIHFSSKDSSQLNHDETLERKFRDQEDQELLKMELAKLLDEDCAGTTPDSLTNQI